MCRAISSELKVLNQTPSSQLMQAHIYSTMHAIYRYKPGSHNHEPSMVLTALGFLPHVADLNRSTRHLL